MTNSREIERKDKRMSQEEIRMRLKIIKITNNIDNVFIAEHLEMTNARSVANFLHGDYELSEEKRRRAEELINDLWLEI